MFEQSHILSSSTNKKFKNAYDKIVLKMQCNKNNFSIGVFELFICRRGQNMTLLKHRYYQNFTIFLPRSSANLKESFSFRIIRRLLGKQYRWQITRSSRLHFYSWTNRLRLLQCTNTNNIKQQRLKFAKMCRFHDSRFIICSTKSLQSGSSHLMTSNIQFAIQNACSQTTHR
jgi:hypothetical protein